MKETMKYRQYSIKAFIAMVCTILMSTIGICKSGHTSIHHVRPIFRPSPIHHRMPPPPSKVVHHHHHRHHSGAFWTGIGIGVFSDLLLRESAPIPRPLVVTPPPVVAINPIWIPPVYETRPVYDLYGRVIRYEQVLIRAGYWQY